MAMKNKAFWNLSVLIADPAPHMATLIASMLKAIGVGRVRSATTTAQALACLSGQQVGLMLVLDQAEDWDGVELTREIRQAKDGPNRDVPILMMSRQPSEALVRTARDAGVTDFLRKPFAAHDLDVRLTAMLEAPRDFIDLDGYTGPDRRRRSGDFAGQDRRRIH